MTKVITGGALGMAPVGDSPQKIIDLGTGSGIWAIEGKLILWQPPKAPGSITCNPLEPPLTNFPSP